MFYNHPKSLCEFMVSPCCAKIRLYATVKLRNENADCLVYGGAGQRVYKELGFI